MQKLCTYKNGGTRARVACFFAFLAVVLLAFGIMVYESDTDRVESGCDISLPRDTLVVSSHRKLLNRNGDEEIYIRLQLPHDKRQDFFEYLVSEKHFCPTPLISQAVDAVCASRQECIRDAIAEIQTLDGVYLAIDRFPILYPAINDDFSKRESVCYTLAFYCAQSGELFYFEIDV